MNLIKYDQLRRMEDETATFGNRGFLPEELINEILLRLPVKSLLRFRTVCNVWHKITTSSSFVHDHLHHETNPTCHLFYSGPYMKDQESHFNFCKVPLFSDEDDPEPPGSIKAVLGPYNGILCVQLIDHSLVLWNPATRSSWRVPDCPSQLSGESATGFGFTDDEFKIVLFATHPNRPYFAIFNSNSNSWRFFKKSALVAYEDADAVPCQCSKIDISTSRSCSYWIKYRSLSRTVTRIVAFNYRTEAFHEIALPPITTSEYATLDSYNGFLAYLTGNSTPENRFIHIWFMKEQGCWTKLTTVIPPFRFWHPIGFWKTNEILLARPTITEGGEIVAYNLDSGTTTSVVFRKMIDAQNTLLCGYPYKESLVSVRRKTLD